MAEFESMAKSDNEPSTIVAWATAPITVGRGVGMGVVVAVGIAGVVGDFFVQPDENILTEKTSATHDTVKINFFIVFLL
jgi:hypothetical protein